MKDIIIVDHISMISSTEVDSRLLEKFTIQVKNILKYRRRIERRKEKINRLCGLTKTL
jgi:hypothetical protein